MAPDRHRVGLSSERWLFDFQGSLRHIVAAFSRRALTTCREPRAHLGNPRCQEAVAGFIRVRTVSPGCRTRMSDSWRCQVHPGFPVLTWEGRARERLLQPVIATADYGFTSFMGINICCAESPIRRRGTSRTGAIDKGDVQALKPTQSLTGAPTKMFEDVEGNIWVTTDGGLDRFRRNKLHAVQFDSPDASGRHDGGPRPQYLARQ